MTKPLYHDTLNSSDLKSKEKIIIMLNDCLAKLLQLSLVTKQAHWNMRGPNFISVHEMLDPFNDQLLDYADQIAERIAQLGGVANGTPQAIIEQACCGPYPLDITQVEDHLNELLKRYAHNTKYLKEILKKDEDMQDDIGANILTDIVQELEKYIWFIEAHITHAN